MNNTHDAYDTIDHEHLSSYVSVNDGNDPLWFMLVECRDGRYFLEAEFDDPEYVQFHDVNMKSQDRPVVFYPDRLAALNRAKEIADIIRPTADKEDLLKAISEEKLRTV